MPEIRTRSEDRDLLQAALHHKTDTILAGANFDMKGQRFVWDSDLQELATNNVYNPPYYGGTYTYKWHPADNWYDRHLVYQAHDYYMTYVRAKDGMAFRLSDSQTLTLNEYIICQKPIPTEQIEQVDSTNVLIQMTMGICNRDLQSVVETTKQAIDQIELITSLKLNISEKSNTLDGFLPNFQQENARPKRSITFSSSSSSSSSSFSTTSSPSTGMENSTFSQILTSPLPPIKDSPTTILVADLVMLLLSGALYGQKMNLELKPNSFLLWLQTLLFFSNRPIITGFIYKLKT